MLSIYGEKQTLWDSFLCSWENMHISYCRNGNTRGLSTVHVSSILFWLFVYPMNRRNNINGGPIVREFIFNRKGGASCSDNYIIWFDNNCIEPLVYAYRFHCFESLHFEGHFMLLVNLQKIHKLICNANIYLKSI